MRCPGSGRIPIQGSSLMQDGKLVPGQYQIWCKECGGWFTMPLEDGMLLPEHEKARELQPRLM